MDDKIWEKFSPEAASYMQQFIIFGTFSWRLL